MECRIFILFFIFCLFFFNTQAQEVDKLFGEITCDRDSIVVEDVHVINLSKKLGTTSNKEGLFKISTSVGDSILFSVLGYDLEMIIADSSMLKEEKLNSISLFQKTYSIPDVFVWPYLTYVEFKQAFINFDRDTPEIDLKLPNKENELYAAAAYPHISLGSPITALYMQFSKEGKEIRKYQETLERDNYENFLASKYNENIVQRITEIKTIEEVRIFMKYCNFSNDFIARSSEYTIYAAIINCFDNYITESN
jgi:hypothetical protein